VWKEGTQVQRVSPLERKEVVSSGRGGMYGHATKGAAKGVEEESGTCPMTEGAGALWRGHSRWGMPIRVGVVYKGGDSIICGVWKMRTERMPSRRK